MAGGAICKFYYEMSYLFDSIPFDCILFDRHGIADKTRMGKCVYHGGRDNAIDLQLCERPGHDQTH